MQNDPDFSGVFESTDGEDNPQIADAEENIDTAAEGETNDSSVEGDTEQEAAAPAAEGETKGEEGKQSAKENAAFAKMRRKYEKERDAAIAKATEAAKVDALKESDQLISKAGMMNPYTNTPITNKDEMRAYFQQREQEKQKTLREDLSKKGVTDDELKKYVDNHPDVLAARQKTAELETMRKQEQSNQAKKAIAESFFKIKESDPSIKTPEDLLNHPRYNEINEKVKKGYSLEDAYFIVNRDQMDAATAKKAEQAARNNINSKGHLQGTQTEGSGGVEVPADEMQNFRELMKDKSDEEIRAWYQKDQARMAKKKG